MDQGSLNTPVLSPFSSQDSISFAEPVVVNYQPDPDVYITELLEQLYGLAQVKFNFVLYFNQIW